MKTTIRWRMPFTLSVLFAAMFAGAAGTAHAGPRAQVWITTSDHRQAMQAQAPVAFDDSSERRIHIEVNPEQRFQRMVGFGASITDSSAWLIQHRMSPAQRDALLRELDALMQALGAGDEAEQQKRMLAEVMGLEVVAEGAGDE